MKKKIAVLLLAMSVAVAFGQRFDQGIFGNISQGHGDKEIPAPHCKVYVDVGQGRWLMVETDNDGFFSVPIEKRGNYRIGVCCDCLGRTPDGPRPEAMGRAPDGPRPEASPIPPEANMAWNSVRVFKGKTRYDFRLVRGPNDCRLESK